MTSTLALLSLLLLVVIVYLVWQRADRLRERAALAVGWHAANVVLALGGRGSPRKLGRHGEQVW